MVATQLATRFALAAIAFLAMGSGAAVSAEGASAALRCPQPVASASAEFAERRFRVGKIEIAYSDGPKSGPTLVFLPGMGVPRHSYDAAARRLCAQFHVVLIDMRGQGESSWASDHSYRVTDYAADVAALIQQQLDAPVIISGHSLGALVALKLAADRGDLIAGLNLEDGPFLVSEKGRWENHWVKPRFEALEKSLRAYQKSGRDPAVLQRMFAQSPLAVPNVHVPYERRIISLGKTLSNLSARGLLVIPDAERDRVYRGYAKYLAGEAITNAEFWPETLLSRIPPQSASMDPDVVAHAVSARLNEGFAHRTAFERVRAPTLYWNSDEDLLGVISQQEHDDLVKVLSAHTRVKHVVASNTGHLIHAEQPEMYAREVAQFFLAR